MRIAILTLEINFNYGGILQCYALKTVLERAGHDVTVLDWERRWGMPWRRMPLAYLKRLVKKCLGMECVFFLERKRAKEWLVITQHTRGFVEKRMRLARIRGVKDIDINDFDAFVVGSDQVWRPKYLPKNCDIYDAFLRFAKNDDRIRRVAYAASFGTESWEYDEKQTKVCARLIRKFNAVSVREKSGVALCRDYLDYPDAVHVLDPTLLLDADDYLSLTEGYASEQKGRQVLMYILDESPEKMSVAQHVAKKRGAQLVRTGIQGNLPMDKLKERTFPPVESWLSAFSQADYVVTDSFHGCVFSIIFGKPFLAIGNEGRGMARFVSLLGLFGLEDRLIDVKGMNPEELDLTDIDYERVYKIRQGLRKEALDFLDRALKG